MQKKSALFERGKIMFNLSILLRNLKKAFEMRERQYSFEEYADVILFYLTTYKRYTGQEHAFIKTSQLDRIMSFIDEQDIEPEAYDVLITSYFENTALQTDFNINHFFTEGIVNNRFYEEIY